MPGHAAANNSKPACTRARPPEAGLLRPAIDLADAAQPKGVASPRRAGWPRCWPEAPRPVAGHMLPLAEAAEAHRILEGRHSGGEIVPTTDS